MCDDFSITDRDRGASKPKKKKQYRKKLALKTVLKTASTIYATYRFCFRLHKFLADLLD